jgi:hypothetical protein
VLAENEALQKQVAMASLPAESAGDLLYPDDNPDPAAANGAVLRPVNV